MSSRRREKCSECHCLQDGAENILGTTNYIYSLCFAWTIHLFWRSRHRAFHVEDINKIFFSALLKTWPFQFTSRSSRYREWRNSRFFRSSRNVFYRWQWETRGVWKTVLLWGKPVASRFQRSVLAISRNIRLRSWHRQQLRRHTVSFSATNNALGAIKEEIHERDDR